jgi:Fe2+ transport system protein FeoA
MTLFEVPAGTRVRIHHLKARPEVSRRLRELGLCETAVISCVSKSKGNVICGIRNTRIGLDHRLARSIYVVVTE